MSFNDWMKLLSIAMFGCSIILSFMTAWEPATWSVLGAILLSLWSEK